MKRSDFKDRFKPGILLKANLHILKRLSNRGKGSYYGYLWRYQAECLRCGNVTDYMHYSIVERILKKQTHCRVCKLHESSIQANVRRKELRERRERGEDVLAEDEVDKPCSFDYHLWVTPPWPPASTANRSNVR